MKWHLAHGCHARTTVLSGHVALRLLGLSNLDPSRYKPSLRLSLSKKAYPYLEAHQSRIPFIEFKIGESLAVSIHLSSWLVLLNKLKTLGMDSPIGQTGLRPSKWPSMLIRSAVATGSSLDPTQSTWELSQTSASSLSHAPAANSGQITHGQTSPAPSASANGCSSTLYCVEGRSVSQMPSHYTQWSNYFASEPHSSTASATFGEQSGTLGAQEFLNSGHSQTE